MTNIKDALGDRMKNNYENRSKTFLTRRVPVIIRVDGKAFHTFTRGFQKPFDDILMTAMQQTMKYLCENIQGCVCGYTQSDEITLVLTDDNKAETQAWFDYNVQKVCSIAASMATMAFNKHFQYEVEKEVRDWKSSLIPQSVQIQEKHQKYIDTLRKAIDKGAMFDARCFNIPKDEVINCLIWRQQDATRNSIQSAGQAYFSHKQLDGKNTSEIQDMLMNEKQINWNNYTTTQKRGSCCVKKPFVINEGTNKEAIRGKWVIDNEIPIFTQDRSYIDDLVFTQGDR